MRPFYLIPDDSIKSVSACEGCRDYMLSDLMHGSNFSLVSASIVVEDSFLMPFHPFRNFLLRVEVRVPSSDENRPHENHRFNISPFALCRDFKKGWDLSEIKFDDVLLRYIYDGDEIVNILWVSISRKGVELFSLLK